MKKLMLALLVLILALTASFMSPTFVSAETEEAVFHSMYNYLVTNPLEEIGEEEIQEYALKVENAIFLAEQIEGNEEKKNSIKDFSSKHAFVLKKYKFFVKDYKIKQVYNLEDYSSTANGTILLNSEKASAEYAIENAVNKKQVDDAFLAFYNFVNSDVLAKNVNIAKTIPGSAITAEATTANESLYFSTDDYLEVVKYNNSAIIKNAKVALLDCEDLLMENGGIAYYFSVGLCQNGVRAKTIETPLVLKINLTDIGLTLEDGTATQIAVYEGNRKVKLQSATIKDNCVVFEINELGEYALCLDGYAIENRSGIVTFFTKYGVYVVLGLLVIFLIAMPIRYARKVKKKKIKAEQKEYKRYKKAKKLEIKKQKKQKRNEKI